MRNRIEKSKVPHIISDNIGIMVVLLILCIIVSLATDKFLTSGNIISVLRQISINTYIALGMTLIIILGHIDLTVGAVVAMCGTLTVGFIVNQGLPVEIAIIGGVLLGVLFGFINGVIVSTFKVPSFIITMAMMNVANGIAYVYSGGQSTRITDGFFISIGTGYLFSVIPLPVLYMILLIIVISFLLVKTRFGVYVYAIGGNREAARLSGIPIKKLKSLFLHYPVYSPHLQAWYLLQECTLDSLPLEAGMKWMPLLHAYLGEHPWQEAKEALAELCLVQWSLA